MSLSTDSSLPRFTHSIPATPSFSAQDETPSLPSKIKTVAANIYAKIKSHLLGKDISDISPSELRAPLSDIEAPADSTDRFSYTPGSFFERLAVSVRVKNKLSQSRLVRLPYRVWCKYLLILLLVLIGAFFTPTLIPRWLGFEWASTQDLCMNKEEKLHALRGKIENITRLPELRARNRKQMFDMICMNESASAFYQAPNRFQWPKECTPELASTSLEDEVCVGPETRNVCENVGGVKKFFANLAQTCKTVTIEKKCRKVVDSERTQALLELEREERSQSINESATETEVIAATANEKATEILERLLIQVDVASDFYIAYSIISLIIGMPLVIYKREKGSQILGAVFGMQKTSFILVIVVLLSFYDSFLVILKETDFSRYFQNLRNDPCYVNGAFSKQRMNLIIYACNNVTSLSFNSSAMLQEMDLIYFNTRRFGICQDLSRLPQAHPATSDMDTLRARYRDGDLKFFGTCNATFLDAETSVAPTDPEFSKFRALLGSGVLAQLLIKFVLTSWLVHLIAYYEPMVPHNGKIEVWDGRQEEQEETGDDGETSDGVGGLNRREMISAVRFARDKHLLPLIFLSIMMVLEVFLIGYSILVTNSGQQSFGEGGVEEITQNFTCEMPTTFLF